MSRISVFGLGVVSAVLVTMAVGCGSQQPSKPASNSEPSQSTHAHTHSHDEETDVDEAFTKLSPADRKLAEAQEICPVSDEPLGSMGTPIKVTVEGRDVFVCCAGCEDELKKNFDEYVAKLEKRSAGK